MMSWVQQVLLAHSVCLSSLVLVASHGGAPCTGYLAHPFEKSRQYRAASACPCCRQASAHNGKDLMENAGVARARLDDVIDAQATTRHDQLEPMLRIGEDGNVLQGISLDDEQIGRGSRSHHAHLSLHPQ
jgi:hypothetical protein